WSSTTSASAHAPHSSPSRRPSELIFWREYLLCHVMGRPVPDAEANNWTLPAETSEQAWRAELERLRQVQQELLDWFTTRKPEDLDRKSTRLNSSHMKITYAVFCMK